MMEDMLVNWAWTVRKRLKIQTILHNISLETLVPLQRSLWCWGRGMLKGLGKFLYRGQYRMLVTGWLSHRVKKGWEGLDHAKDGTENLSRRQIHWIINWVIHGEILAQSDRRANNIWYQVLLHVSWVIFHSTIGKHGSGTSGRLWWYKLSQWNKHGSCTASTPFYRVLAWRKQYRPGLRN